MFTEGEAVRLTAEGLERARNVVRRHRLAERLLVDLLDVGREDVEGPACRFEHVLNQGVDDRICTLLGHPPTCPHGKLIPRGRCCEEGRASVNRLVTPLTDMRAGQRGSIAYLRTSEKRRLRKLLAMGVLPGQEVEVIQRFPAFVFDVGRTQIAVDSEIASDIYVRVRE
ncbi:MAG: metal-dependent transcriptional regulator [Candidatus Geothermarchaeales archaeon]